MTTSEYTSVHRELLGTILKTSLPFPCIIVLLCCQWIGSAGLLCRQVIAEESKSLDPVRMLISTPLMQDEAALSLEPQETTDRSLDSSGDTNNLFQSGRPSTSDTVDAEKYGEAPVDSTRQFLRRVTPLLARGQCQVDYGLVYSVNEFDFLSGVGGGGVADISARRRSFYTPLAVRYGLNEDTQLSASTLLGWSQSELADSVTQVDESAFGIGDLQLGITRLLCDASSGSPSVIGTMEVSIPTGDEQSPIDITDTGFGTGAWSIGTNLLAVHSYDPVVVFYGAGYRYTFDSEFQGNDFQFGHQINYNLGVGFSANERVTFSTILLGNYVTESEINGVRIANSNLDAARIRFALTTVRKCKIVEPFVEIGITDAAPDLTTGVVWTR